jgi:hypothetical protein
VPVQRCYTPDLAQWPKQTPTATCAQLVQHPRSTAPGGKKNRYRRLPTQVRMCSITRKQSCTSKASQCWRTHYTPAAVVRKNGLHSVRSQDKWRPWGFPGRVLVRSASLCPSPTECFESSDYQRHVKRDMSSLPAGHTTGHCAKSRTAPWNRLQYRATL